MLASAFKLRILSPSPSKKSSFCKTQEEIILSITDRTQLVMKHLTKDVGLSLVLKRFRPLDSLRKSFQEKISQAYKCSTSCVINNYLLDKKERKKNNPPCHGKYVIFMEFTANSWILFSSEK